MMEHRPRNTIAAEVRQGHVVSELRKEGKELVDEDRLTTLFMDLFVNLKEDEEEARETAREAMEILRG